MIKINNTDISDIKINNESISKVYLGSDEVWQTGPQNYRLFDILYSDANGNLSVSNQVLPVSDGKTPIALCIAGTNFFGEGEKARWISLKYMNCNTPDTGSLTISGIVFGNLDVDIVTVPNISSLYNGGSGTGYLPTSWQTHSSQLTPAIIDQNNEWNLTLLGAINTYALTDINGKNKTASILATATSQSTWQTDAVISNTSTSGYAPSACCCARYHTLGTLSGEWYLCSAGELAVIVTQRNQINTKLAQIADTYSLDSISYLNNSAYATSTEVAGGHTFFINIQTGLVDFHTKVNQDGVIAMLQY